MSLNIPSIDHSNIKGFQRCTLLEHIHLELKRRDVRGVDWFSTV
jgi:hypothetical protein